MMITDYLNLMVDSDLDYLSFFNLCCFSYSMIKRQQILLSNIRQIALNLKKVIKLASELYVHVSKTYYTWNR